MTEYEIAFNPQAAVPDFLRYSERRLGWNREAKAALCPRCNVPYGPHARHRLDVYPVGPEYAEVHLFFHGGYWRTGDKEKFAFIGGTLSSFGISTVVPNYELRPESDFGDVVSSAANAFEWLLRNWQNQYGAQPGISISGHSAGAHLAASILSTDWAARNIRPFDLRGALLVSGVFDPAVAMKTSVNAELQLTPEHAGRFCLDGSEIVNPCRVDVCVGAEEPDAWRAMSAAYFRSSRPNTIAGTYQEITGRNHFAILDEYNDPESLMVTMIREYHTRH